MNINFAWKVINYCEVLLCSLSIVRTWDLFAKVHFVHKWRTLRKLWNLASYSLLSMITRSLMD